MNRRFDLMAVLLLTWLSAACASGADGPADLDTRNDVCAYCRMLVSDRRTASQFVAPREDPKFFDSPGCLVSYLKAHVPLAARSQVFTVDSAGAWAPGNITLLVQSDSPATMRMRESR